MYMYMKARDQMVVFSSVSLFLRSFTETSTYWFSYTSWIAQPRDPFIYTSPVLELQACAVLSVFLCGCWKSRLRSSCLQSVVADLGCQFDCIWNQLKPKLRDTAVRDILN